MTDICVPGEVASQLAYHMGAAVRLATAGRPIESASETVLAWALLSAYGHPDAELAALDLPTLAVAPALRWDDLLRRTQALALQLQAHFVSEGQHATATVYETAAGRVCDLVAALQN